MDRSAAKGNLNLLKRVEERSLARKMDEREHVVPYLPKECISNILLRLSLESLSSMRFVCKQWFNIIASPDFINAHLRRSESVLIYKENIARSARSFRGEQSNTFSVEARLLQSKSISIFNHQLLNNMSTFSIQYVDFKERGNEIVNYNLTCSGNIRATCNGLILVDNKWKKGGLVVMNPITRKLLPLPVGTLCSPHNESYGFTYNEVSQEYKVVHLFLDELRFIGCETLWIGASRWKEVNGPSFGLFSCLVYNPVSAIGALHWIPHISESNYLVSMEIENDKFHRIALPKTTGIYDRILKKGDFLCYVTSEEFSLNIKIWILKGLFGEEWTMHHRITKGVVPDMIPVCSMRISGDMIFLTNEAHPMCYFYDESLKRMIMIGREKMTSFGFFNYCLTHVNSLVSWEKTGSASASEM